MKEGTKKRRKKGVKGRQEKWKETRHEEKLKAHRDRNTRTIEGQKAGREAGRKEGKGESRFRSCKASARIMAGGNTAPMSLVAQMALAIGILTSNGACGLWCGCHRWMIPQCAMCGRAPCLMKNKATLFMPSRVYVGPSLFYFQNLFFDLWVQHLVWCQHNFQASSPVAMAWFSFWFFFCDPPPWLMRVVNRFTESLVFHLKLQYIHTYNDVIMRTMIC